MQHDWMTPTHEAWLRGEPFDPDRHDWAAYSDLNRDDPAIHELDTMDPPRRAPFLESAVTGRRLWGMFREEIAAEHVRQHPGTRPARWWQFDAPEPRLEDESEAEYLDRHGLLSRGERKSLGLKD